MPGKPAVYFRPDTSSLWIKFYDENGRLVRRSAHTADKREAWSKLEVHLKQVAERKDGALITAGFSLFMTSRSFKKGTRDRYDTSIIHWVEFCDQNAIEHFAQLTKKSVSRFVEWRKLRGSARRRLCLDVADATIRRDLAFLSSAWSFLREHHDWEERMPACPISRGQMRALKESRKRVRAASQQEWQALLDACSADYQRIILTIAVETGLRAQELCQLQWPMVDLGRRQIVLLPELMELKNDSPRVVPLSEKALRTLCSTMRHKTKPWVFWHGDGQRFASMAQWWKAVRRRAGVQNFRFHDIRHTFASNFLNAGGDIAVLREILGHSSIQVTERYAHMRTNRLHEEIRRIALSSSPDM